MNHDSWLQVRCPSCDAVQLAPPGGQARCYACQKPFLVPHANVPPAAPPPSTSPAVSPAPADRGSSGAARPEPALEAASATSRDEEGPEKGIPLTYLLAFAGLLVVAMFFVAMSLRWVLRSEVAETDSASSVPRASATAPPAEQGEEPLRWADASQVSVRANQVLVGIPRVEYAEVLGRDQSNRIIVSDGKRYLLVHVKIQNAGPAALSYRSWYGNAFDEDGTTRVAHLVDPRGRSFDLMVFADARAIKGHVAAADLAPGDQTGDVLVFHLPEGIPEEPPEHLLLELPAVACGGTGFYRFRIPCTMIRGWEEAAAPDSDTDAPRDEPAPSP